MFSLNDLSVGQRGSHERALFPISEQRLQGFAFKRRFMPSVKPHQHPWSGIGDNSVPERQTEWSPIPLRKKMHSLTLFGAELVTVPSRGGRRNCHQFRSVRRGPSFCLRFAAPEQPGMLVWHILSPAPVVFSEACPFQPLLQVEFA